jgi:hypothetical protein
MFMHISNLLILWIIIKFKVLYFKKKTGEHPVRVILLIIVLCDLTLSKFIIKVHYLLSIIDHINKLFRLHPVRCTGIKTSKLTF